MIVVLLFSLFFLPIYSTESMLLPYTIANLCLHIAVIQCLVFYS